MDVVFFCSLGVRAHFFTTKPTGQGTGLGLSISYHVIVQQHKGEIKIETEEGKFTEFVVRLPRRA